MADPLLPSPVDLVIDPPYRDVHKERIRAHAKHAAADAAMEGRRHDDPAWLPVLTEEVGEVARVLCEAAQGNVDGDVARQMLRDELVQVAAMACAWIDACDLHRLTAGGDA